MGKYIDYLDIQEEVKAALEEHRGVVALESTIISHGMPYPQNVEMAKNCERIIRKAGAVPATIAIIDGRIKIGLSQEDLQRLASADTVMKVSRRDLAVAVAERRMGATTVATTMMCAAMAGIQFFVTGGVGGVHRGYEETMDVSADLEELAQSDVTVICAGAKSILDIPRTLEYLETKGVTVIGYQSDTLEHTSFGKVKRKQQKCSIHAGLRRDGSRSDTSLSDGQGLKSQSHSCFHGRMAVTSVILHFFVPAAFNEEEHEHGRTEKQSEARGKDRCGCTRG